MIVATTGQEFEILRTVVGISVLVLIARLFAALADRVGIPQVTGEILAGIVMGPYALGGVIAFFGYPLIDLNSLFLAFAQIGVIIVLLAAGLEFTMKDLKRAGFVGAVVAFFGVLFPFVLGYMAGALFGFSWQASLIIGAALTATSVAVTFRVLEQFGKSHTKEAAVIISAAMIDDIFGIVILSLVVSVSQLFMLPSISTLLENLVLALLAWVVLLFVAVKTVPRILRIVNRSHSEGAIEATVTMITFGLSALVSSFGLSGVIGAFIAGIASAESEFAEQIRSFVFELRLIFGPLFFAVIGTYLDPKALALSNLPFVFLIVVIAMAGKYIGCGFPAMLLLKDKDAGSKVGMGMMPRAEVGFIVIGVALASAAISTKTYSMILAALIVTTAVSPALLGRSYGALGSRMRKA